MDYVSRQEEVKRQFASDFLARLRLGAAFFGAALRLAAGRAVRSDGPLGSTNVGAVDRARGRLAFARPSSSAVVSTTVTVSASIASDSIGSG